MRFRGRPGLACLGCWLCLWSTCSAGPQIPAKVQQTLELTVGAPLTTALVECSNAVASCDVAAAAKVLADRSLLLHKQFRDCPSGCHFQQTYCDDFFTAVNTSLDQLASGCAANGDWGGICQQMMLQRDRRLEDPTFELGVMCSVISPGPNYQRTPQCSSVASATIASYPTLSNCQQQSRQECVGHFCALMAQFRWRIRPRNLQDPLADNKYPYSYILPGCEVVEQYAFDNASCHTRLDVQGFCDCMCEAVPAIASPTSLDCPADVDEYLLFGRFGIQDVRVSQWCKTGLCDALDARRSSPACASLQLPAHRECRAMHLPYARNGVACPWLDDSGQDHILECMDGHRCSVLNEGWDCCESHRGRGKCPRDTPVMCDNLCGGEGEYCCKQPGACQPRECSPIFQAEPIYQATSTTTTTTLPPPGGGAQDDTSEGFSVKLPTGWWIWLLLIVPFVILVALAAYWWRRRHSRGDLSKAGVSRANISDDCDGMGGFKRVRPTEEEKKPQRSKPVVAIDMPHLPETRPLGVELLETKVVRLHPWGMKCGFKVGDIIVDIGGEPVSTFEEIWERIQVERSRPPVRFVVERHGALPPDLQEAIEPPSSPQAAGAGGRPQVAQAPPSAAGAREAKELREAAREAWPAAPIVPESPSGPALSSPRSASEPADSEAIVLPEEDEAVDTRPRRQRFKLPPPVYQKSRFEAAFGKESRDRLAEIVNRHSRKGATPHEVRWVQDPWGRSVMQTT